MIAAYLLKAGQSVVVGQMWNISANVGHSPVGPMLYSSANLFQGRDMERSRSAGYPVLAMDEEVLALAGEQEIVRCMHPLTALACDEFLFHDAKHQALLRQVYPSLPGKITGNPRVELLTKYKSIYEPEARRCKKAGKYILINTNFSLVNSVWGSLAEARSVALNSLDPDDEESAKDLEYTIAKQTADFEAIGTLIDAISKRLPSYRIVVRPHPSESPDAWKKYHGVEVVTSSNPLPWMLGAELLVHTGSTTGFEAVLLGTPCINVGMPHEYFNLARMNCSISDTQLAVEAVMSFMQDRQGPIAAFKVPHGDLVMDGAKNIANALLETAQAISEDVPIASWGTAPRLEAEKGKFSVSLNLFLSRINAICAPIVGAKLDVTPLDDSVFLISRLD